MSGGALVKRVVGSLAPKALLFRGPSGNPPKVALTFDDGPHPEHTPRILEVLARHGAVATFFVQGSAAEQHPALVRAVHAAGHQVANHGYDHTSARHQSPAAVVTNAIRSQSLLEDQLGCELPRDFRPPYGDITIRAYSALRRLGFRLAFWSFDSEDSFMADPIAVASRIAAAELGAGSVVLMHDDYAHTVEALPAILQHFHQRAITTARTRDF